jgi:hypothetical protein
MEKQTIIFYTGSRFYKGWKYLKNTTCKEIVNWLRSGNYVVVGKEVFSWQDRAWFICGAYSKYLK